ncbi:MAG TPA: HdeD family acid-resistance protein [Usitatibacter sp.]|nr:HdeD family acid-resistance protein [Usitatibacter sp.]
MSTTNVGHLGSPSPRARENGWRLACGLLLIVAGILAILMPGIAALSAALVLGWILLIGGGIEIAYAIQTRALGHFGWKLTSGILDLVLGIAILVLPLAAVASLGLLIGAFLFVGGIARVVLSFRARPMRGWGWVLLDGILSILLAILIAIGWPGSSVVIIGIMLGIWLLSAGAWRIALRHPPG